MACPDLAVVVEACRQLEETYSWAIQRLQVRGSEGCGGSSEELVGTQHGSAQAGAASRGLPADFVALQHSQLESREAGAGLAELRRPAAELDLPNDLLEIAKVGDMGNCLGSAHPSDGR